MTRKIYLQAVRDLPEEWIDEKTDLTIWGEIIVAANPKYIPMRYYEDGKWNQIDITTQWVGRHQPNKEQTND